MSATIDIPLRSRRVARALLAQRLNHVVPAGGLLFAGLEAFSNGVSGFEFWLAIVEIVTSGALLVTVAQVIRTVRRRGNAMPGHSRGIDWGHMWAAAVLFAELAERWHLHHHVARPILLTALVTLALGFFHAPMMAAAQRRRSLRLSDTDLYVSARPFSRFKARLTDIQHIRLTDRAAEIRARSGRTQRIDLADLHNAPQVREALQVAQRRVTELRPKEPALPVPPTEA
jgi:hypothetical protein